MPVIFIFFQKRMDQNKIQKNDCIKVWIAPGK